MSTASPPPSGIYVPVPTFFAEVTSLSPYRQTLDLASQCAHAIHLAKSGITGLVLCGSTGEAVHLTQAERVTLISTVKKALVEAGYEKMVIVTGTASQNVDETLELIKESKQAGAEYALVLTPSYFAVAGGYTDDGMGLWFTSIADQSVLPILVGVLSFL